MVLRWEPRWYLAASPSAPPRPAPPRPPPRIPTCRLRLLSTPAAPRLLSTSAATPAGMPRLCLGRSTANPTLETSQTAVRGGTHAHFKVHEISILLALVLLPVRCAWPLCPCDRPSARPCAQRYAAFAHSHQQVNYSHDLSEVQHKTGPRPQPTGCPSSITVHDQLECPDLPVRPTPPSPPQLTAARPAPPAPRRPACSPAGPPPGEWPAPAAQAPLPTLCAPRG
jgi:hypothetical protein